MRKSLSIKHPLRAFAAEALAYGQGSPEAHYWERVPALELKSRNRQIFSSSIIDARYNYS
jgi:hypothetical protein